ncbi:hypothetical protein HZH66_014867 [Vespula vulgaris]|uniref:Uncharacterized protein n=1 Tax=Vespula vulgaris TaxID=7454 RepID=A0A834J1C8_VESVU|nr:hypothetical protein HZH66_014867 [Vespula vulgaris]
MNLILFKETKTEGFGIYPFNKFGTLISVWGLRFLESALPSAIREEDVGSFVPNKPDEASLGEMNKGKQYRRSEKKKKKANASRRLRENAYVDARLYVATAPGKGDSIKGVSKVILRPFRSFKVESPRVLIAVETSLPKEIGRTKRRREGKEKGRKLEGKCWQACHSSWFLFLSGRLFVARFDVDEAKRA